MKKTLVLNSLVFFLSLESFAQTLLDVGIYYYTPTNYRECGAFIDRDTTGEIALYLKSAPTQNGTPCTGPGSMDTSIFLNQSGNFWKSHVEVSAITLEDIKYCMPNPQNNMPCDKNLYDKRTGQLLFRLGDQRSYWRLLTVLNTKSFEFTHKRRIIRNGEEIINFDHPYSVTYKMPN